MKRYSAVVLSAFIASVVAQDSASASSSSSAPAPTSSLIPSNVSATCKSYLDKLDKSSDISQCMSTLVTATQEFNPTVAAKDYSDETLATTLKSLCGVNSGCEETKIRTHLAEFYSACQDDLLGESPNAQVATMYDILYTLTPLRTAICAQNDVTQKYCVQEIHVDNSTSTKNTVGKALIATSDSTEGIHVSPETLELLDKSLYTKITPNWQDYGIFKRADENDTLALMPDTNTWRTTSLVYLFISPSYTAEQLCTSCTKQVLQAYVRFEAATPYAMGLSHSPLLGDQADLWRNVTTKCGNDYSQTIMSNAGIKTGSDDQSGTTGTTGAASRMSVAGGVVAVVLAGVAGLLAF